MYDVLSIRSTIKKTASDTGVLCLTSLLLVVISVLGSSSTVRLLDKHITFVDMNCNHWCI